MVRIWRFSRQKRCFKSDTRVTKSVTTISPLSLEIFQRCVNLQTEAIRGLGGDLPERFLHHRCPKLAHMRADLFGYVGPHRNIARNLIGHLHEMALLVIHCGTHAT